MNFFRFKKKNAPSAIGIIGGADGPTAIFTAKKSHECQESQADFLTRAATALSATSSSCPSAHSIDELESYLILQHHAVPFPLSSRQEETLKVNVILNYFAEVLTQPPPLKEHPSKRELLAWCKKDTRFEQARAYPAEKLGLVFQAYQLPDLSGGIIELERQSGYYTLTANTQADTETAHALNELGNELILWLGVSAQDIMAQTPRFIQYAYLLKEQGIL